MLEECPGAAQYTKPKPEFIECPNCGAEVEIWTDEQHAKCDGCGKLVSRPRVQGCIDWCEKARECLGAELYDRLVADKAKKEGAK